MRRFVAGLGMLVALAGTAGAQSWTTFPDGSVGYTMPYTFTGGFACGTYDQFYGTTCTNTGSGVHLVSGDATLDLSFTGVSGTTAVTNTGTDLQMGAVTVQTGGTGPFTFASSHYSYVPDFFHLTLAMSGVGQQTYNFVTSPGATSLTAVCCSPAEYFAFGVPSPQPPGAHYTATVLTNTTPQLTISAVSATLPITARIGVVPEPSSLALLATGLLPLVPLVRRRARRS